MIVSFLKRYFIPGSRWCPWIMAPIFAQSALQWYALCQHLISLQLSETNVILTIYHKCYLMGWLLQNQAQMGIEPMIFGLRDQRLTTWPLRPPCTGKPQQIPRLCFLSIVYLNLALDFVNIRQYIIHLHRSPCPNKKNKSYAYTVQTYYT